MAAELLAICVGNTRTRVGLFHDQQLMSSFMVGHDEDMGPPLEQAYGDLAGDEPAPVLLASTNPSVAERVTGVAEQRLGTRLLRCERDLTIPVGRQLDREAMVGDDRLLNAAAAFDRLKQACIIIDAGTAMTVDLVDGAGTFHGGAILPGARMMLRALHDGTGQLPEVAVQQPVEAVGHNTAEAMRSGVYHGLRGAARELTESFAEAIGAYPMVIATGGDAELLFEGYDLVERIVPDLTLLGLALTWRVANSPPDG